MVIVRADFSNVYHNVLQGSSESESRPLNFDPYTSSPSGAYNLPTFTDPYVSSVGNTQRLPTFTDPYVSSVGNAQRLPTFTDPYKTTASNSNSTLSQHPDFFSSFTGQGQNDNQSYLDQYANVKPAEYQVSQLDLDETKANINSTLIDSLGNKSLVSYYKGVVASSGYKAKLDEAAGKIKDKKYDSNLAELGFFRDYLYNVELQNSIFDTKLSSGQRRHNYEVFNQALNSSLGTKDADNPLNVEMEKYIIPEMMRLMAKDGIKVMIQNGSNKTAYEGNKSDAANEFVFQMDNMNWRTQIGDEIFTKYAKTAINNAQDPNAAHSYTRMYESALVDRRKNFNTQLNTLKGKESNMIAALKSSSRSAEEKTLINGGIGVLEDVLANDLKYGNSQKALEKVDASLGKNNAISLLILYLVVNPIEITAADGSTLKIDATNVFKKDSKTNEYYLNDERIKTELQAKLETLKTETK
ncbi:MAG: hypothetical protein EBR67_03715 [Proteobacteria bacterium]|nr:hypothetical protein [Pseudomonadota bacterium]